MVAASRKVLVVDERVDPLSGKTLPNLDSVHLLEPGQLNTYDVLVSDDVVFTEAALASFVAGPPSGRAATAVASSSEVVTDEADTDEDAPDYGPDSHGPLPDDAEPEGFPIKGNASSKLYHVPGSAFYNRTIAAGWFKTTEAAEAAGFQLPPSQRADADAGDAADAEEES